MIIILTIVGTFYLKPMVVKETLPVEPEMENSLISDILPAAKNSPLSPSPTYTQTIVLMDQIIPSEQVTIIPTSTVTITLTTLPVVI